MSQLTSGRYVFFYTQKKTLTDSRYGGAMNQYREHRTLGQDWDWAYWNQSKTGLEKQTSISNTHIHQIYKKRENEKLR